MTTNGTTMLANKLFSPRIYTLCIIDTNLIKNCGRIKGVSAFNEHACGCSVVIFSCSQSMLTEVDKWVMRAWRVIPWKQNCVGAEVGTDTATVPRWLEIYVSKRHNEYPGEAERALSKIHLQFIEATHGESSRGVYHGNCWGLMASRADWAVGLLNNELFSPINLALTYKKSITCYTSGNFFFFWWGRTWASSNF